MLYGLYLSSQGADVQSTRLDVIANNLANSSTHGFKRDLAVFMAHRPYDLEHGASTPPPGDLNRSTGGISLADVTTDFSPGQVLPTGGTYDVALVGPGFLRVSDGRQTYLTRSGRMTVDSRGELVTGEHGHRVLGAGGSSLIIPADATEVAIGPDGTISAATGDGERSLLGRLDIVRPRSVEQLEKRGQGLFFASGEVEPAGREVEVRQGFLESSGTQPISEMMRMIETSRMLESNMNMIRLQDETLARLLQSVPRR